jgi:hypothetical protein
MSNFLIVESRKNDVIIIFLNLCALYCKINNLLLMLVVSRLIAKKDERKFMIAEFFYRRHFLENDLVICRYFVSAWVLWLLMSKFECWQSWKDKKANDLISLRTRRCKTIWLSDWWLNRTSKHFWLSDEFHDVLVRKNSAKWSSWSEKEDSHWKTRQSRWTTTTMMCRKCWKRLLRLKDRQLKHIARQS